MTNEFNNTTLVVISMENLTQIMRDCFQLAKDELFDNVQVHEGEQLLTTDEVTKRFHVDRSTLWRWNKDKYLCPIKVGKKNMYKESDLIKLG